MFRSTRPLALRAARVVAALVAVIASVLYAAARPADAYSNFTEAPDISPGTFLRGVAVGDFNGDAKTDIVAASTGMNKVVVRLGDGAGNSTAGPDVPVQGPVHVAVRDFNGDAKADLAVLQHKGSAIGGNPPPASQVAFFFGDGLGNFSAGPVVGVGLDPWELVVGDLNGDGSADFAVSNRYSHTISVRLGDGAGNFSNAPDVAANDPFGFAVGDFNRDTKADLIVTNRTEHKLRAYLGDGAGNFTAGPELALDPETLPGTPLPSDVTTSDFNGDGKLDLAVSTRFRVKVYLGDGAGNFNFVFADQSDPAYAEKIAVADFNGDAKTDMAYLSASSFLVVRLGDGAGAFSGTDSISLIERRHLAVGDFNGDDRPDITVTDEHRIRTFLNQDTSPATPPTCRIRAILAGPPKQVVVGASDLRSGIREIKVTTLVNATVVIEPYNPFEFSSTEIRAVVSKIDQSLSARVAFVVTDGTGQQASCL